jgi:microcystin-dependent protein
MNQFLGQIIMFGGNFAPAGWAFCNGQLLSISQNSALYTLLGTTYGGDGQTTFGLPNLQSRLPVHQGTGGGLSTYVIGQVSGTENVTIINNTMPSHSHNFNATTAAATANKIANNMVPAVPSVGNPPHFYAVQGTPPLTFFQMAPGVCTTAGGSLPHTNLMPSLCVTFVIALTGAFPSRN